MGAHNPRSLRFAAGMALLGTGLFGASVAAAAAPDAPTDGAYRLPPQEIRDVLEAPELPDASPSPDGRWLLLTTPERYPPLADRAAPMVAVAGIRIDPRTNGPHTPSVSGSPALQRVSGGSAAPVALPAGARILSASWSADSQRLALVTVGADHVGLWIAGLDGAAREVAGLALDPVLGSAVDWMPDQRHLLVKAVPSGRTVPAPPALPLGPIVRASDGATASSTYEARDLIASPYDEALFQAFATSQIAVVDAETGKIAPIGTPDVYGDVAVSPDGRYLQVDRVRPPWSHRVGWRQFAHDVEVWTVDGRRVATVASLPAAEQVPIDGVPLGARAVHWRASAPSMLVWTEALDGGDPRAKADHRDQVMALSAPFSGAPKLVFTAVHRVVDVSYGERGLAVVSQSEWERRWRHVWLVDADRGPATAKPWFDLSENDRYANPGGPLYRQLPNGAWVLDQDHDLVYFAGQGSTPSGDRPFVDRRSTRTTGKGAGQAERLFRSPADVYESFVAFGDPDHKTFLVRRQAPDVVPNLHLVTLGATIAAAPGEPQRARTDRPVTTFADPTPQIRGITKRIVQYTRADGVPLSFTLYLPPGYVEGTRLPTVLYAYPREFSDARTAGQVSGSDRTFDRLVGPTHLFFLLEGYAVLNNTTMPVLGDPETAYDTFVDQLVADATAAVDEAVRLGVTDRDRVGVMGHSHGALMTMTLLAHSDLFRAGIARSGAYNHTIRPFGFQNEIRTLWEARDTYLGLSPVMFAPQIDEPALLIHGAVDENPGTVPLQSERLFEAIRGTGGTARLVLLPAEGHAYRALASVEHVLAEQIDWFDRYVKGAGPRSAAAPASEGANAARP